MKKFVIMASILACASAFAGNNNGPTNNNEYNTYNQQQYGGAGGNGTGVGVGVGLSESNSSIRNSGNSASYSEGGKANATGGKSNSTSHAEGGAGGAGGTGGSATGGSAVGSVAVQIEGGATTYREAAQTAYSPAVPTVAKSCRLYVGIGGSSRDGSGSGGIPIGNDQTCLSVTAAQIMIEVNKAFPGAFQVQEVRAAVCKIEGMNESPSCKQ